LKELPSSIWQLNATLSWGGCLTWKNYLHLLANWMHFNNFLYTSVPTWKNYFHLLVN
jgi:hypothetical protein